VDYDVRMVSVVTCNNGLEIRVNCEVRNLKLEFNTLSLESDEIDCDELKISKTALKSHNSNMKTVVILHNNAHTYNSYLTENTLYLY
jgi:hypothetical protein